MNGGSAALRQLSTDVADLADRLGLLEHAMVRLADGVSVGAAVADILEHLDERLASIEVVLDGYHSLAFQVDAATSQLGDHLDDAVPCGEPDRHLREEQLSLQS